jgi:Mg2+ and Co2+ transporter CorA
VSELEGENTGFRQRIDELTVEYDSRCDGLMKEIIQLRKEKKALIEESGQLTDIQSMHQMMASLSDAVVAAQEANKKHFEEVVDANKKHLEEVVDANKKHVQEGLQPVQDMVASLSDTVVSTQEASKKQLDEAVVASKKQLEEVVVTNKKHLEEVVDANKKHVQEGLQPVQDMVASLSDTVVSTQEASKKQLDEAVVANKKHLEEGLQPVQTAMVSMPIEINGMLLSSLPLPPAAAPPSDTPVLDDDGTKVFPSDLQEAINGLAAARERCVEAHCLLDTKKDNLNAENETIRTLLSSMTENPQEVEGKVTTMIRQIEETGDVSLSLYAAFKDAYLEHKDSAERLQSCRSDYKEQYFEVSKYHQKYDMMFAKLDKHFGFIGPQFGGLSAQDCKDAGLLAKDCQDAGYTAKDCRDAGYTAKDCRDAGYTAKDCRDAGYTAKDCKDAGLVSSAKDCKGAGYTAKDCRDASYTAKDCKDAGYTAKDCKDAGYSAKDCKDAGLVSSAKDCKDAGYSFEDCKDIFSSGNGRRLSDYRSYWDGDCAHSLHNFT